MDSEGAAATSGNGLDRKRDDVISWEDYFMGIAFLSAQRSKDPSTQVGACIVNKKKRIVGVGYNGMPNGCSDDKMPWGRGVKDDEVNTSKYLYVCHAELNAIMNKNSASLEDCIMYVSLFPCNECAKLIVQSGIKKVIYKSDKYSEDPKTQASKKMFEEAEVTYEQYTPTTKAITINFDSIE